MEVAYLVFFFNKISSFLNKYFGSQSVNVHTVRTAWKYILVHCWNTLISINYQNIILLVNMHNSILVHYPSRMKLVSKYKEVLLVKSFFLLHLNPKILNFKFSALCWTVVPCKHKANLSFFFSEVDNMFSSHEHICSNFECYHKFFCA